MKKKKSTILVIGGTGFIGYHLLLRLVKLGWIIFSISKKKPKKNRYIKKVKYFKLNLNNFLNLEKKINTRLDYVVNLSDISHNKVKKLFNYFKKGKIKKFIQIGSSAEYGNNNKKLKENFKCKPISKYGKNKLKITKNALEIFKKNSFPIIVIRLFQVYGSADNENKIIPYVISNFKKDKTLNLTKGDQTRDFCHVNDVINAIILVLRSKNKKIIGKIFNVGSGKSITIKNLVNKIQKIIKKGKPVFGKKKFKSSEIIRSKASITKIKKIINWSPKVSLDKGIDNLIRYEK